MLKKYPKSTQKILEYFWKYFYFYPSTFFKKVLLLVLEYFFRKALLLYPSTDLAYFAQVCYLVTLVLPFDYSCNSSIVGVGFGTFLCFMVMIALLFMYDHNLRSIENPGARLRRNKIIGIGILGTWIVLGFFCHQFGDIGQEIKKGFSILTIFVFNCLNWSILYFYFVRENPNMRLYCRSQRQLVPDVMPWQFINE